MTTFRDVVEKQSVTSQEVKDIVVKILEGKLDPLLIVETYQAAVSYLIKGLHNDNDKLRSIIKTAYKSIERAEAQEQAHKQEQVQPTVPPLQSSLNKKPTFTNTLETEKTTHKSSFQETPGQETQGEIEIDLNDKPDSI